MADEYLISIIARLRDEASQGIRSLQREVAQLRAQAAGGNATSDLERGFDDLGDSAGDSADEVARHNDEMERMRRDTSVNRSTLRSHAQGHDDVAAAADRHASATSGASDAQRDLINEARRGESTFRDERSAIDDLGDSLSGLTTKMRDVDSTQTGVYERFHSGRSTLRGLADDLRRVQTEYANLARQAPIGSDIGDALNSRTRSVGQDARQSSARATGSDLTSSYRDFNAAVKSGSVSTSEAQRGYQSFANDFTKVSRAFDDGSVAAREFGKMADDAGKKLDNIPLAQSGNSFDAFAARVSSATDNVGVKIISLSAALRGLRVVGIVGLFQQIDTAVVGLAGSLFALASDAAEAGAALGGALVSGLAQAIPVTGVLLAGIERIKSVLDAVKLSQQIQQQSAFDPTQDASTQLSTSEALTSAQDGLVDAYNNVTEAQERVTESQEQLTQARIDAIRNITDLTIAEKTATEQATGARLSLVQAEQALQQLQQTGGTNLEVQQAELAVQEARTGVTQANIAVPRSRADAARARRLGVGGSLAVRSASDEASQARLDLTRAHQAVPQASAELRLAQLRAASPSGSETSDQGQLNYLKQQFSQPELILFNALDKLENQLKQKGSPLQKIGDDIVEPIAGAVDRVSGLLKDPKFMGDFERLGTAIKSGLDRLLDPKGGKGFLEAMANDATANAPKITGVLASIESLFMSIATAAAPELHQLLTDLDGFLTKLAATEASAGGQDHLTAEFDLWGTRLEHLLGAIGAFHGLLKALGEDAAPAGDNGLTSLTKSMDAATAWVQGHGPEVKKFFTDTMDVLGQIGDLLFNIGKLMLAAFTPASLQVLNTTLSQILLPAIANVANAIGFLITNFLKLVNMIPGGKDLLIGLVTAFTGLLVVNKVADAYLGATRAVRGLWDAMKVFQSTGSITAAFKAFAAQMDGVRTSAQNATTPLQNFGNAGRTAGQEVGTGVQTAETALTDAQFKLKTAATADGAAIEEGFLIAPTVGKNVGAGMTEAETEVVAAEPKLAADSEADGAGIGGGFLKGIPTVFTVAALVLIFHKQITDAMQKVAEAIFGGVNTTDGKRAQSLLPGATAHYDAAGNLIYTDVPTRNIGGSGPPGGVNQGMEAVGPASLYKGTGVPLVQRWSAIAQAAAKKYGLPASLLLGDIQQESGGNTGEVSSAGAFGLTQFTGSPNDPNTTAGEYHVYPGTSPAAIHSQIFGQAALLASGVKSYGSITAALEAYYGGPRAVADPNEYVKGGPTPAQYAAQVEAETVAYSAYNTPGTSGVSTKVPAPPAGSPKSATNAYSSTGGASPYAPQNYATPTAANDATIISQWRQYGFSSPEAASQWLASVHSANKTASPTAAAPSGPAGVSGRQNYQAPSMSAFLTSALKGLPTFIGIDPSNAITLISQSFASLKNGFGFLNTVSAKARPLTKQINDFITFTSQAIDQTSQSMAAALQQLQTRLGDRAIRAGYTLANRGSWQSLQSRPTGIGGVISRGVGVGDEAAINQYEDLEQPLQTELAVQRASLAHIVQERKRTKLITNAAARKAALQKLNALYEEVQANVTTYGDQVATNLQNEYQAEQQAVQDELTNIANVYQTQSAQLQGQQSGLQALGNYSQLPTVDQALVTSSTNQIAALQDALHKAQAMGDATTVAAIQQQIAQLNESIMQYTAQAINDAVSAIQAQAQNDSARTQMYSSLAGVATTQGNFALAGSLSAQSYRSAITSDNSQVASYAGAGANLNAIANGDYSSVAVNSILGQALATGNQGAVATIVQALDGVQSDLATNTQALTDNTAATDDAAASYTQARGQFQSGVYGGLAQIVQTIGQTTGYTDTGTLEGLYKGSNNSLTGANNSLAATLAQDFGVNIQGQNPQQMVSSLMGLNLSGMEAGMDPAQAAEFENLISSIITNTEAITQNNLQLAQLNGQLTQPQSFSSSLWTNFRDAIFTGMGGLQPSYASSLGIPLASNPAFTGTGIAGSSTTTHINVSANPVLPEVDPYTQGRAIAFALKTPQ